jgi:acyl-CoA dehydrogenase
VPDSSFLDWPFFEQRHRRLAADLDGWAAATLGDIHGDDDPDADCRRIVAALGDAGWLALAAPAPNNNLDVRSLCLARETLARYSGLADFAFAMQGLGSGPITLFGSDEARRRYLPGIGRGERIAAFALSEPDAGSDVAALKMTAVRAGADYVLDGTKTWISNGGIADQYVIFARTGGDGARGISAFVVDADTAGLHVTERIRVNTPHPLAKLVFAACRIPATQRVGGEGEGFKIAMATLDVFRASVGAAALGFARRALDEAVGWVTRRRAFGQPLAEFQLVQERLAEMAMEIDAAALLVYRAAWVKDRGAARVTREAAMAKLYATEVAQRVIDSSVQLLGARGVVWNSPVERLYREVRALRIYEGTSEIQKLVIARQVLSAGVALPPE